MGLLNIIRRMHLRQKLSIRQISRRTGLSRNTVTRHLATNTIEPISATPERPGKLDPFAKKLAAWLKTEAGKSRKARRTLKQLHGDLVAFGYAGSYGRVAAYARGWRTELQRQQQTNGRGTFVQLSLRPGGVCQSSCHLNLFHAASRSCPAMGAPPPASWGSASAPPRPCRSSLGRSGFSQTDPTGFQFRVLPDQRAGYLARAA
ncbi:helix-turn-helix domain-containing protein [Aestuariivirga sp.]|uniref:helix-turn-helix domain-containing protein n=1 Tax=Aestuariivirga sp. TaxID=2650926 RepID=UPI0037852E4A